MAVFSKNTERSLTKLQGLDLSSGDENECPPLKVLNPHIALHLDSLKQQHPDLGMTVILIKESICAISDPECVRRLQLSSNRIVDPLSQIPDSIAECIAALERTLLEWDVYSNGLTDISSGSGNPTDWRSQSAVGFANVEATHVACVLPSAQRAQLSAKLRLEIDPGLQKWLPKSTHYLALALDLKQKGLTAPIRYWKDGDRKIIIDGIDRYLICKSLGIKIWAVEEHYASYDKAIDARIDAHLVGRQLTQNAIAYLLGARYIRSIKKNTDKKDNVARQMGRAFGKNEGTIRKYGNFYRAIEFILSNLDSNRQEEFKSQLLGHQIKYSWDNLKQVFNLNPQSVEYAVDSTLCSGRLLELPKIALGAKVVLKPNAGNRDLDDYISKIGQYIGLGPSGKPLVEIEGELLSVEVSEILAQRTTGVAKRACCPTGKPQRIGQAIEPTKLLDRLQISVELGLLDSAAIERLLVLAQKAKDLSRQR